MCLKQLVKGVVIHVLALNYVSTNYQYYRSKWVNSFYFFIMYYTHKYIRRHTKQANLSIPRRALNHPSVTFRG